eukprot:m.203334 g.203334  ORF g.203334 m.203334 type:complete len:425 (+) comp13729_c0_seq1:235-1509(+)
MSALWKRVSRVSKVLASSSPKRKMLRQVLSSDENIVAVKVYPKGDIVQLLENGRIVLINYGKTISEAKYTNDKDSISISCGCFAKTKKCIAVFTSNNEILIATLDSSWRVASTAKEIKLKKLNDKKKMTIRCMEFSHDDKFLVTGGADNTLRVYEVATGIMKTNFIESHKDIIVGVTFSPCGRFIATGCKDKHLRVFEVEKLEMGNIELTHTFTHDMGGRCYAVAFSPSGNTLAAGSDNNKTILIDMKDNFSIRREIVLHKDHVRIVAFVKENQLLTGGKDGDLYLIDVISGQAIMPIHNVGWAAMVSHYSGEFVTCSQESSSGPVRHMNIFNIFQDLKSEFVASSNLSSACKCLCFSPSGETVYFGCKNGDIHRRDVAYFRSGPHYRLHKKRGDGYCVFPNHWYCGLRKQQHHLSLQSLKRVS